jgi:uncharacterized protein
MALADPPPTAAWRHRDARDGFEVVFLFQARDGYQLDGWTSAVEEDRTWAVHYSIVVDPQWQTRSARVRGRSLDGTHELTLETNERGIWLVNGEAAPALDDCLDLDLEASALTNAFPVHRLGLEVGQEADAPAAYVRALDLSVERLEQHYVRLENDGDHERYYYASPAFKFEAELVYDKFGFVLDYPGIAIRVA